MNSKFKKKAFFLVTFTLMLVFVTTVLLNWSVVEEKFLGKKSVPVAKQDSEIENAEEVTEEEELLVKYEDSFHVDGFAGADPSMQAGDNLTAFLDDNTFFDRELTDYEKLILQETDFGLYLIVTSVEQDMRIQVVDNEGTVITGIPFQLHVKDVGSYKDHDRDGVIYIGDLKAGNYEVSMDEVEGFEIPVPAMVHVKEKVEYTAISDIALLMKTEDDIVVAKEDTAVREALNDVDGTEITDLQEVGDASQLGIDVSKYNGAIDWDKVRNAGIQFAIIRAGYRGSSTGTLVEDPYFRQNMQGAIAAGLKVGVYFFTQAVNEVEAVEEASMVMNLCQDYKLTYPIFIDTEGAGGDGRADNLSVQERTAVCKAFCETIESANYTSGVYASRNWLNNRLYMGDLDKYVTWLAEYREKPEYGGTYQFWQYTSSGYVDGIEGRVDLNISYLMY